MVHPVPQGFPDPWNAGHPLGMYRLEVRQHNRPYGFGVGDSATQRRATYCIIRSSYAIPAGRKPHVSRLDVHHQRQSGQLVKEVSMGKHNPLGFPRGSGGKDDGRQIVPLSLIDFPVYFFWVLCPPILPQANYVLIRKEPYPCSFASWLSFS